MLTRDLFIRSGEDDTDGDEENSDDSGTHSVPVEREPRERIMKKPVTLDVNGVPWGNMKECLADDVKKYAKSLDGQLGISDELCEVTTLQAHVQR